ncbi:UDP-N-acetylmuramoyl-L-alanyl-D-glutamate--2,6-diaminopimelate ligase [Spirochaeta cellobiosiphila]|uniref:UDP-N-acetylmuramoyl-L-alanyl-D-glutamate--2, 6-diaminopimelate ligase n=1 Tax=Spirochaeta cellobiosiphila TaxID=504483 RepID=UPI0004918440|nr:UDP-N-acetylmuramoyl-L-alanyl-D-glutamate--2,6-diaminopimelate ligase [Spirochaeta cellobiosiphila]
MEKSVVDIIKSIKIIHIQGPENTLVNSLIYDSRDVIQGSLFFALEGIHTDGHKYVEQALEKGATAVIHSQELAYYNPKILYVKVPNTRKALSPLASAFYDYPSQKLKVLGVTGTDGKSTTVNLCHQLLQLAGKKSGLISTVQFQIGDNIEKNALRQSTPEASEIHKYLYQMLENGKEYAVVESTSHGLAESNNRLGDVDYDGVAYTNVTQEHLEFHGTLEQYRKDKSRLFMFLDKSTNSESFGVINLDDPHHELFKSATTHKVFSYSIKDSSADLFASLVKEDPSGTDLKIVWKGESSSCRLNIPQSFNVENLLACLLLVSGILEINPLDLIPFVPNLEAVKGRMCPIKAGQDFHVIVDYAHTPGSFERVFPDVKNKTTGRLFLVFGSAGERDLEKRPKQGEIASRYADKIFLTDEDPRLEDSMKIIKDIQAGCPHLIENEQIFLIPNREEAFKKAFSLARSGDTILLLGKGHESNIIQKDGPHPWDEIETAYSALASMGYTKS